MHYKQGKFKPEHPEKYCGKVDQIFYRSSWEMRIMKSLDKSPNVIRWSSEELIIPYYDPTTKRIRRYFPDFLVTVAQKNGQNKTFLLEVKPESQTVLHERKRMTENYKRELITYAINQAKWKAAESFCQKQGWVFKVITEKDLGIA